MNWKPTMITTIDGRQVLSDSPEWRSVCEAVYTLGKPEGAIRHAWIADVERKRGAAGRQALEEEMDRVEPAFLLAMGTVEQRRAYLSQVEHYRGEQARKWLEQRIVALWEQRKAAQVAAAS